MTQSVWLIQSLSGHQLILNFAVRSLRQEDPLSGREDLGSIVLKTNEGRWDSILRSPGQQTSNFAFNFTNPLLIPPTFHRLYFILSNAIRGFFQESKMQKLTPFCSNMTCLHFSFVQNTFYNYFRVYRDKWEAWIHHVHYKLQCKIYFRIGSMENFFH